MSGDPREILVGGEQRESMLTAGCGNQEINWTGVNSLRATDGSQTSGGDIGPSVHVKERIWVQESEQPIELFCGTEAVEEFLKDIADQKKPVARFKVPAECTNVRISFIDFRPSQDQGPYGRVNDQIHGRDDPSCSPIPSGIRSCQAPSEYFVADGAG